MGISPSSGTQNGVTGWFELSGSTVIVSVSSTSLYWRINGTNSGGDHGVHYIGETRDSSGAFVAESGHKYAFQVCSSGGTWSNGIIFTVDFESGGGSGGSTGEGFDNTGWGYWAEDIYFGDKCRVTWMPATTATTYRLEFSLGNYSVKTAPILPGISDYYTYTGQTIPVSAATNIPNSTSGVMTVSIIRYSDSAGNNETGSRMTTYFTVTLKDSVVPTISSCSAAIDNSGNSVLNSWGVALAKYSKVKLSASASGVYGSTIVSYTISGSYNQIVTPSGSSKSLSYTGPAISSSGNKAFTITCTDSRGRISAAKTTNLISFLPYTEPKITKFSVDKETYNDANASNDRMVVSATWSHASVDNRNSSSGKVYYKTTAASDWTLHSGTFTSGSTFTLSNLVLEEYTSYNFMLLVTDTVGNTARVESFSSTTPVLLDFKAGGDGLGVGKVCEAPGMEVSMDATFFKEVYIGSKEKTLAQYIASISPTFDMIYPVGSIYMSMVGTNPELLFGGSWEQLPGRFLLGAGGNDANTSSDYGELNAGVINRSAGEKGGEVAHKLTKDELAAHTHDFWTESPNTRAAEGSSGVFYPWYISGVDKNYTGAVKAAGGDQAHNNMPPYLAVYMWKRVA